MRTTSIVITFLLLIMACKKDASQSSSNNCSSSIPSYQDTITVGATNYSIVASYGAQQKLLIELVGYTGQAGVTLTVDFLQVKEGTSCYENSTATMLSGSSSKAYEFNNVPTWADDVSASAFIKVTINGNVYYLHDAQVNQ